MMTAEDNFKNICDLTTNVMGLRKGSLSSRSRETRLQVPRMIAAMIGRIEEDISHSTIAKALKRDRTLIYHYERKHKYNYSWELYRDAFNKIYMAYKHIEDTRKIFFDMYHMKEFLFQNGVKEHPKDETRIFIKSGEVGVHIKTSYFDFSNQLENVKIALKDYKYTIEIK